MKNTILVTGASGTFGSQVVKQLTAIGADVRAVLRSTSKAAGMNQVSLVAFDLNKPETVQRFSQKFSANQSAISAFLRIPLVKV